MRYVIRGILLQLSKKESVKETATSNGDVTVQTEEKNGAAATTSVSVTTNGKTIENKDASDGKFILKSFFKFC